MGRLWPDNATISTVGLATILRNQRFAGNSNAANNDHHIAHLFGKILPLDTTVASSLRLALHWRDEKIDFEKATTLLRATRKRATELSTMVYVPCTLAM